MYSLDGDCIYTHYPPLADWLYALVASVGTDQVYHYKHVAIFLNGLLLLVLFRWLRNEFDASTAFFTLALTATLPSFLRWADALYYQPFQFLFLMLGCLTWRMWQESQKRSAYVLTWAFFFLEALVSYELILFYAIMLVGLIPGESGPCRLRERVRLWLGQALAPVSAFLLHFALKVSLFGFRRVLENLSTTIVDRSTSAMSHSLSELLYWCNRDLVPWPAIGLALIFAFWVFRRDAATQRHYVRILGVLLVGGLSFSLVLPGTAAIHSFMMYRHFFPFAVFTMALIIHSCRYTWTSLAQAIETLCSTRERYIRASGVIVGLTLLGHIAYRNCEYLVREVRGNIASNRSHAPNNLAARTLDAIPWNEAGKTQRMGSSYLPTMGLSATELPDWVEDFRLDGPSRSHYELWWLDAHAIGSVRILIDRDSAPIISRDCTLGRFVNGNFQSISTGAKINVAAFVPTERSQARAARYLWWQIAIPDEFPTRALRLTCTGPDSVAIHQMEVYGG